MHDGLRSLAWNHAIPLYTTIELVARCNLRCRHCYVTRSKAENLDLNTLETTFEQLADLGGMFVNFTGGEIGMRADLFAIIAAARERRFAVMLLTSGTRFDTADWHRIRELDVQAVRLSLYSTEAHVHDRVTLVPGSHERTMATLHGLRSLGVAVEVNCPVLSINEESVEAVARLGDQLEIPVSFDPRITCTDAGRMGPKEFEPSTRGLDQFYRVVQNDSAEPPAPNPSEPTCGCGRSGMFIDSSGNVFPCINWPAPAGSLHNESLASIWTASDEMQRGRQITVADLPTCLDCPVRSHCGPCPALNLSETGEVASPSPTTCRVAKAAWRAREG